MYRAMANSNRKWGRVRNFRTSNGPTNRRVRHQRSMWAVPNTGRAPCLTPAACDCDPSRPAMSMRSTRYGPTRTCAVTSGTIASSRAKRSNRSLLRVSTTFDTDGFGYFALELQDRADELIGFCGHRRADIEGQIELLYGIHPTYWGEGLVAEAAREVLRFGFESCAFDRVIAATDTPNQQSVRVLQKLGMTFQCRREFHGLDTVFYSMTRSEFFETD